MKIPTSIDGYDGKEEYERIMNQKEPEENKNQTSVPEFKNSKITKSDYLKIPNSEKVISKFEIPGYNNLTWEEAHFKLQENGLYMPVVPLFMTHFMNVLNSYNSKGRNPLFDASGNPISKKETEDIYLHLIEDHIAVYGKKAGAWTWLDASFKEENGVMKMLSEHRTIVKNGNKILESQKIENLESCLTEDCFSDLKFNSQGLLTTKSSSQNYVQGKNIYFWYPRDMGVAGFCADSDRASLDCNWDPSVQGSGLGVFAVAQGGL